MRPMRDLHRFPAFVAPWGRARRNSLVSNGVEVVHYKSAEPVTRHRGRRYRTREPDGGWFRADSALPHFNSSSHSEPAEFRPSPEE